MKESLRYLNNAKEILKSVPVEGSTYTDIKPVREAMGTAYLAVLEAITESLAQRGLAEKELLEISGRVPEGPAEIPRRSQWKGLERV